MRAYRRSRTAGRIGRALELVSPTWQSPGPVELVDQLGGDSLDGRLEVDVVDEGPGGGGVGQDLVAVIGHPVFVPPEPARPQKRGFDAAADKISAVRKRRRRKRRWRLRGGVDHMRGREARVGVAAVDVAEDIRGRQPTTADAAGPGTGLLDVAGEARPLILTRALEAGKVEVGEHTADEARRELIIGAAADHAEIAFATLPLLEGQRRLAA